MTRQALDNELFCLFSNPISIQVRVIVRRVTPTVRLALLQGRRTAPAARQVNISCLYSTLDTVSETTDYYLGCFRQTYE